MAPGASGIQKLPDGELRYSGGYCLLPPSRHPKGPTYDWLIPPPDGQVPRIDPFKAGLWPQNTQALSSPDSLLPTPPIPNTQCVSTEVEKAVQRALPDGSRQRKDKIFELARALKGLMPGASAEQLRPIVHDWHGRCVRVIRTKDFTMTWIDFVAAWGGIRPLKVDIMAAIVATAKTMPTPAAGMIYDIEPMRQLVAICAALQQHHGVKSWPLSCRLAAKLIGVSHDTAARMLKTLQFDRVIELAKPAVVEEDSGVAAEYRYIGRVT